MPDYAAAVPVSARILNHLETVDSAYKLGIVCDIGRRKQLQNDILQTVAHQDLAGVILHVLHGGREWLEFRLDGDGQPTGPVASAFARSGKLPPKPSAAAEIQPQLMLWRKSGMEIPPYEDELQLRWNNHSGGSPGRRTLRIIRTGAQGYGFADTCDSGKPARNVFCHVNQAPLGHTFHEGELIQAKLEQTPKGMQAHRIVPLG